MCSANAPSLSGWHLGSADTEEAEASLEELARLTETSGSDPVDVVLVKRDAPDPATFVGKGKVDELAAISKGLDIDVVVFDNSLSPAQQRNLQRAFDCDVVDRQAVILDIFAQHATTREGMAQVEMALLQYLLPRLRGQGQDPQPAGFRRPRPRPRRDQVGDRSAPDPLPDRPSQRRPDGDGTDQRHPAQGAQAHRASPDRPGRVTPTPASRPCSTS